MLARSPDGSLPRSQRQTGYGVAVLSGRMNIFGQPQRAHSNMENVLSHRPTYSAADVGISSNTVCGPAGTRSFINPSGTAASTSMWREAPVNAALQGA